MAFANWYLTRKQPENAEQLLLELIQQHPEYAPAHNNMALLLLQQKRLARALQHANTAVALGGQHKAVFLDTLNQIRLSQNNSSPATDE